MTAHVALERLSALLDGELTHVERGEVERHVTACPACRERLGELRAVADGLAGLDRPAAPRALDLTVAAVDPRGRRRPVRRSLRPVTGALVLPFALVAALAIQLLVTHAGGLGRQRAGHDPAPSVGNPVGETQASGSSIGALRFEGGTWRPAAAPAPTIDARPATPGDWRRLRAEEPELARFAERHRLELPFGSEWIRFDPAGPLAESPSAQPAR